ncbi:MAG TPA: DNA cytosine methyltransferase [Thiomonas arsenitoxydans]|uniref:DNA cytosine methyltransferase n=1 Tax=Thiomonas arsenitoxydans (strain DSM 22701 / CIP 110005 / 3As) TaxID=426114 RepID=UPI002CAAACCB|nr:DNA cytosine methyltransferase [Thiomonas arsenitoxydans]HML83147.1 DNA cytosine methyltransferase [Thiomonas arsenitoxydans]
MIRDQFILDLSRELIIDNFAGGGGASCGIERALGRHVDIAINHDPEAVAMHTLNHPQTEHHCESVWDIDPLAVTQGRPVGLAWFSPDCKHFSKAKGGKPRDKRIRGLAWVAVRWAALVRPRVIILENVEEFQTWGPLLEDGTPCPARRGDTFRGFVHQLQEQGYAVEWRELRACDYGAPTTRKRLFLVARCDGRPIVWPAPTHGAPGSTGVKSRALKPWRTAAECIDWSIPTPSIFERDRPLAEATMRRIGRGVQRYVIKAKRPFVVETPAGKGAPTLIQTGYGERAGQAPRVPGLDKPLGTIVAGGAKHALVTAFLAKHFGGNYTGPGAPLTEPMHTVTTQDHHALVCAFLTKYYGNERDGVDVRGPLHTILTVDRFGLVTVEQQQYRIADIGMRMLEPRELYRAQGFPESYQIAPVINGKPLPKRAQVRMCGNSVSPPLAAALARANVPEMMTFNARELRALEAA